MTAASPPDWSRQPDTVQSIEAEQGVIGIALICPDVLPRILQCGGAGLFHHPVHRAIYEMMAKKQRAGELVSPITDAHTMVGHEGLQELGGGAYLVRMAGAAISAAALPGFLSLLADLVIKRRILAAASEALHAIQAGNDDTATIAARLEAVLLATCSETRRGPVTMRRAISGALAQISAAAKGGDETVAKSGLPSLDRLTGGFRPGELILLGGRSSMGKSAVALAIGLHTARSGKGVAIASLEMAPEALAMRALAEGTMQFSVHPTSYAEMRQGNMAEGQVRALKTVAPRVADLPIAFLPREFCDIGALLAGALRLLVVDYAQLVRAPGRGRYEVVTEVSTGLKALAAQLDVPVLALSQLSRQVEERKDKRAVLADLRESGQLEQDADAVIFTYRDSYYLERLRPDATDAEAFAEWSAAMDRARNRLELIVAKQRQGEIGVAHVLFDPAVNYVWEGEA